MTDVPSDYLAIGFVPSAEMASNYIRSILNPVNTIESTPNLLRKIIHEAVYDEGFTEIVIPLSGGFDSRSLLGAALDVYERDAIHCMTVGSRKLPDFVSASRVCRRLGLDHERIDPDELEWDLDHLEELARAQFQRLGSLIQADALMMFEAMAQRIPREHVVLSGYLGDAVSGKHLPRQAHMLSSAVTTDSFIQRNQTDPGFEVAPGIRQTLLDFVSTHAEMVEAFSGAVLYDLLDFGFRQCHRIKPVTTWAFARVVTPYEDPRWITHWFSRPYSHRVNQSAYKAEMTQAFPALFSDDRRKYSASIGTPLLKYIASSLLSQRNYQKARSAARSLTQSLVEVHENRGDPRRNESMAAAMRDLLSSFDHRKILEQPVLPRFASLLARPNVRNSVICRWVASTELHIRAGNLSTDTIPGLEAQPPRR